MSRSNLPSRSTLRSEEFRTALSLWPSGVTITTTIDGDGRHWGFTASAFSSVSLDPPLILVCLATEADCHDVFIRADGFAVNLLGTKHEGLAVRFATKGQNKFVGGEFVPGHLGYPVLEDAVAVLECASHSVFDAGDHTILVGEVMIARSSPSALDSMPAMVHVARTFRAIGPERDAF